MKKFSSTMKASSRRSSRNKKLRIVAWVAAILLVLIFTAPWLVRTAASLVITPVVKIENWLLTSQGTVPAYLRDRNELLDIQQDLKRELAETRGANFAINQLAEENKQLRSLLGASSSPRIAAGVIGRPTKLPYDTILIDRGASDGIIKGAPVFIGQNQTIGFVGAVYENTAVVALVTTPGIESTVYIYGPNIYTTAEGFGGGLLQVRVPQGIKLEVGNLVVMPTFETGVYGEVVAVESVPTRPEQFGYVSIETPISSMRFVSVGTKPLEILSFEEAKEVVKKSKAEFLTVPVPEGVLVDTETSTSTAATSNATSS